VILTVAERELRLEEEIVACNRILVQDGGNGPADRSFVIMLPLVGGVDPPKSFPQCEQCQPLRLVLLPRGSIEESGMRTPSIEIESFIMPFAWCLRPCGPH
jgi:hypothetical protein